MILRKDPSGFIEMLPASVAALSLALLMQRLGAGHSWGHFLEGLFTGLGFAIAVYCLVTQRRVRAHE